MDPTTPDIHLGHTVVLRKLREFQDLGHTVVLIIGDYTARVGDPSGRSSARPDADPAEIDRNAVTYQEQAFKVLDRERTEVRRNGEWLDMRDGGPLPARAHVHGRAAARARRLRQALRGAGARSRSSSCSTRCSRATTRWPCARTSSSAAPTRSSTCSSRATSSRPTACAPQSILTMPILPGIDGEQKMSKSLGNYVGVDEPPEEVFGKLMRVPDAAMPTYYDLLMDDPLDPSLSAARPEARARARAHRAPPRRRGGRGGRGALRPAARGARRARRRGGARLLEPTTARSTCPRSWPTRSASRAPRAGGSLRRPA